MPWGCSFIGYAFLCKWYDHTTCFSHFFNMLIITGDCFFFIDFNLLLLRNLFIIFKEILPFYSFFLSDSNLNSYYQSETPCCFYNRTCFFLLFIWSLWWKKISAFDGSSRWVAGDFVGNGPWDKCVCHIIALTHPNPLTRSYRLLTTEIHSIVTLTPPWTLCLYNN